MPDSSDAARGTDDLDPTTRFIFERLQERTEPEPDGTQNVESNVWTGSQQLKADTNRVDHVDRNDVAGSVSRLVDLGLVLYWHGLLAPATDEHLHAVIECEHESDAPRQILIGKCNRLRRGEVP